jgi:processive 1,2-diacylglycerol beta-glucosyltransferase
MKLLILSASTGGGHDMRANALHDWWIERGGSAKVYHPLETSFIGYRFGCNLYNFIQRKLPFMHFAYFYFLEFASMHRGSGRIVGSSKFLKVCSEFQPRLVVSMHSHLNHGYFDLLRIKISQTLPFAVYCGELADGLGFSRHWINPSNNLFAGPTEECCQAAQKRGMPAGKCLNAGPLLRKSFYKKTAISRKTVLEEYNLDPKVSTYLLTTGANGVNNHKKVIQSLIESGENCQVIALCGTNVRDFNELERSCYQSSKVKVVPLKTVNDSQMADFLKIVDCVFARPGAGSSTEALVSGCPIIFDLSKGIMPQETNNLNYWKKYSEKPLFCRKPSSFPKLIKYLRKENALTLPFEDSPKSFLSALENLAV